MGFMPAFKYRQKNFLIVLERGHKAHGYVSAGEASKIPIGGQPMTTTRLSVLFGIFFRSLLSSDCAITLQPAQPYESIRAVKHKNPNPLNQKTPESLTCRELIPDRKSVV